MYTSRGINGATTQRVRAGDRGVQSWIVRASARHVFASTAESIRHAWRRQRLPIPLLIAGVAQ